ncbi:TPA: replication protein, partial [Acinetobacter baumannii]
MYGQNTQSQREQTSIARGLAVASADAPLVKYTDNSSILVQQGFQRLRDRFKLLNKVRKILKGERTQHCFF